MATSIDGCFWNSEKKENVRVTVDSCDSLCQFKKRAWKTLSRIAGMGEKLLKEKFNLKNLTHQKDTVIVTFTNGSRSEPETVETYFCSDDTELGNRAYSNLAAKLGVNLEDLSGLYKITSITY